MKKTPYILLVFVGLALLNFNACKTDFEINAPQEDILAVYCVLNPQDTVQYIRIGMAYQVEGDALEYAAANDLSIKGLTVKLKTGGQEFTAVEVDSFPKDVGGIFFPYMTMYKVSTNSALTTDTIIPGKTYTLTINSPEDPLYTRAKTSVPDGIRFKGDVFADRPVGGLMKCRSKVNVSKDIEIRMNKGTNAVGYEIKASFGYFKDGVADTVFWGPTAIFTESKRCIAASSEICYKIPAYQLQSSFQREMPTDPSVALTYFSLDCAEDVSLISKAVEFEMTAIDEYLYNYMLVNNPLVTDLSGSRPEYTNFSGTVRTIGILGSINTSVDYTLFNDCSEYLLNLNGTAKPSTCFPAE